MISYLLLILSLILSVILLPIGFIYGMLFKGRKEYLFKIALSIDQLGNVVCGRFFNWVLIKKNGYLFGFEDETISSVLGKNKVIGQLKPAGRWLDRLLNKLDENHSINSIEIFKKNNIL